MYTLVIVTYTDGVQLHQNRNQSMLLMAAQQIKGTAPILAVYLIDPHGVAQVL